MRSLMLIFSFVILCFLPHFAAAQEKVTDTSIRKDLSVRMHQLLPVENQVKGAVDSATLRLPLDQKGRDDFKQAIMESFDLKSLEAYSVTVMADIFTKEELQWMVDFYSQPVATSVMEKMPVYYEILMPEVTKMLDKAYMRIKTGAASDKP